MSWSDRQQSMLEAMGLRVWSAPPMAEPVLAVPAGDASAPAPAAKPAQLAVPAKAEAPPLPVPAASALPLLARPLVEAGAVAGMDWAELREAVSGCRACGLCESRKHTVFGVGHERAHWMVVGEAPGQQEDLQGEPFVGPAGQLLDSMLRAIGLTRAEAPPERQVFIANTLKCRPPSNRNPEPGELGQCEPYLNRQIALVQPRIILAMGRFAVQSLLRSSEPIGKLRGRVHEYQGVPLIVTYHPAYLLRNLVDKARAWEDLCLAMDTLQRKT
jgi:uracil-DNA glycosylase